MCTQERFPLMRYMKLLGYCVISVYCEVGKNKTTKALWLSNRPCFKQADYEFVTHVIKFERFKQKNKMKHQLLHTMYK